MNEPMTADSIVRYIFMALCLMPFFYALGKGLGSGVRIRYDKLRKIV